MAVPKRKTSKAVTHQRKAANMKKKAPGVSICPQCHEPKLPHRVCPNCNYYDGKDIMEAQSALMKTGRKRQHSCRFFSVFHNIKIPRICAGGLIC